MICCSRRPSVALPLSDRIDFSQGQPALSTPLHETGREQTGHSMKPWLTPELCDSKQLNGGAPPFNGQ